VGDKGELSENMQIFERAGSNTDMRERERGWRERERE